MAKHIGIALALATALASVHCAGGGPSGTHFSAVKGNVVDAGTALQPRRQESTFVARFAELFRVVGEAWAQSGVEGIRVSIEGTPFETVTDASGNFFVGGDFEGAVTVLFEREADGLAARLGVEVPQGGTVTLHNVSCRGSGGICDAEDVDVDEPSDDPVSEPSEDDVSDASVPSPSADDASAPSGDDEPSEPSPTDETDVSSSSAEEASPEIDEDPSED